MKRPLTYRDSGVDVDAGNRVVDLIRGFAAATARPESLGGIGGFGGLIGLRPADARADHGAAAPALAGLRWRDPVLVSGADGVGTKLKIAFMLDKHDTVGLDCVAYNVNDVACPGAEPLFFLDYIGIGRLIPEKVATIVKGVAAGCLAAGCALVGGETAELPGLYAPDEYDLAGFAVGVVERERIIDGSRVAPGDILVGLASTGLQSSGFSLVRRAVFDVAGHKPDEHVAEFGRTLGEELLTPTAIYPKLLQDLALRFDIRAIANITGGGFYDNIPRVIPEGLGVRVRRGSWPEPPVFDFVRRCGNVEPAEMFRTFNMGVGMAVVVPADQADAVCRAVAEWGGLKEDPDALGKQENPAIRVETESGGLAGAARPGAQPAGGEAFGAERRAFGAERQTFGAERQALAPLVELAQPPRRAWPIGEIVPEEKLGAATIAARRRVTIVDKGGREF